MSTREVRPFEVFPFEHCPSEVRPREVRTWSDRVAVDLHDNHATGRPAGQSEGLVVSFDELAEA